MRPRGVHRRDGHPRRRHGLWGSRVSKSLSTGHGEGTRDAAGLEGSRGARAGSRGGFLAGSFPRPGAGVRASPFWGPWTGFFSPLEPPHLTLGWLPSVGRRLCPHSPSPPPPPTPQTRLTPACPAGASSRALAATGRCTMTSSTSGCRGGRYGLGVPRGARDWNRRAGSCLSSHTGQGSRAHRPPSQGPEDGGSLLEP